MQTHARHSIGIKTCLSVSGLAVFPGILMSGYASGDMTASGKIIARYQVAWWEFECRQVD